MMQLGLGNYKALPGISKLISHRGTHFTKVTEMKGMELYFQSSIRAHNQEELCSVLCGYFKACSPTL